MVARQYSPAQNPSVRVQTYPPSRRLARQTQSLKQTLWTQALMVSFLLLALLFAYSCPVAQLTRLEYQKSKIRNQLRYFQTSNEILEAEVERLSSPTLVRRYAEKEGMVLAKSALFTRLKATQPSHPPSLRAAAPQAQPSLVGLLFATP